MDDNKSIYETFYTQASFKLGGDSYSQAMHAMRFDLIERYGRDRDVLDVGCATGEYLRPMVDITKSAIGLDYTQRFLDEFAAAYPSGLPSKLKLVCGDAREMPLPDASVDFAYSYATLYHVPAAERVVAELGRVVRPGGHIAIEMGNQSSLNTLVSQAWHEAEDWARPCHAGLRQIARWLHDAGFEEEYRRVFQLLPMYAIPRRLWWVMPLSGVPLRSLLGRTTASGRLYDEMVSGLPGVRNFAFRHLIVARRIAAVKVDAGTG